jgi:hypothetical protein
MIVNASQDICSVTVVFRYVVFGASASFSYPQVKGAA